VTSQLPANGLTGRSTRTPKCFSALRAHASRSPVNSDVRRQVIRTYSRKSRAIANGLLLVFLALVYLNGRDGDLGTALLALGIAGTAIVYYGYFIASQRCSNCRESIVVPYSSYEPTIIFFAVITPFRVPVRCPHCGAMTHWTMRNRDEQ
jgi:hypothetical protein